MKHLFRDLKPGEVRLIKGSRNVMGEPLSRTLDDKDHHKIIASNHNNRRVLNIYKIRQEIETLFGCLKIKGFRFEDTHITEPARIDKLLVLLAIGFCWVDKRRAWLDLNVYPLKRKLHGRMEQSLFRYGLDFIRDILFKFSAKTKDLTRCLRLLLPYSSQFSQGVSWL